MTAVLLRRYRRQPREAVQEQPSSSVEKADHAEQSIGELSTQAA